MNQTSNRQNTNMDLQLIQISKYHSLIISKNIGSILLIIYVVTAILLTRDSVRPFYVLAANNFLPFLLSLLLQNKIRAEESLLPLLSKKYHYTYLSYFCNSLSFLFVCVLLYLLQQRELRHMQSFSILSFSPLVILFVMFVLRLCGNIYYHRKFHQMLIECNF